MDRLRSSSDIRHVMTAGTRAGTNAVSVHLARPRKPLQLSSDSHHRIAVVAGRRIGNAVKRNRAKRRLRALIPTLGPTLPNEALDIILVAKPGLEACTSIELRDQVNGALHRALRRYATTATAKHPSCVPSDPTQNTSDRDPQPGTSIINHHE